MIPIQKLIVFPLEYGHAGLENALFRRGENFWMCKQRTYVTYMNTELLGDAIEVSRVHYKHLVFSKVNG